MVMGVLHAAFCGSSPVLYSVQQDDLLVFRTAHTPGRDESFGLGESEDAGLNAMLFFLMLTPLNQKPCA